MSHLFTRIGGNVLKFRTLVIRNDFKKVSSAAQFTSKMNKKAITYLGIGIAVMTPVGYVMYTKHQSFQPKLYDETFTYYGKGKVISDVKVAVEEAGTTLNYTTDNQGKTNYSDLYKKCNSKEYEFVEKKGKNPKVVYSKDRNSTQIRFGISRIQNKGSTTAPEQ